MRPLSLATPRRAVLALPVLFLALSLDRVLPERLAAPRPLRRVASLREALSQLSGRNVGRLGRPGDALNLVFVGSPSSIRAALRAAGWTEVPGTIRESFAAGLAELVAGKPLAATPPMNDYWLDGRRQDMNWAEPIRPIQERHHFRLWDTGLRDARGRPIWWGSGDYDQSVRWTDLSHVPNPDMNVEREHVAAALRASPLVGSVRYEALPQIPRAYANDKGYPLATDGRVALVELLDPR